MNLLNQLRGNFPKTIDKNNPIFSMLIANDKGTGCIQKQLNDLMKYMKEWISTPDVYKQKGIMLDKTITFFSFLEPFADESEDSLKNRFRAIFVRNHDKRWGTVIDVKNVFRQYFPHATIYVVENTNKIDDPNPVLANLLLDGDIDTATPSDWTLTNCSADAEARFSKAYGILLNQSGASLSQDVELTVRQNDNEEPLPTTFFLHFFLKGKVCVKIKNSNDYYWNNETKLWNNVSVDNCFESLEDWENQSLFFILDADDTITISFEYVDTKTYIDYFRLFQKQLYGSFTVIAHFRGDASVGVFGLAAGESDPNITPTEEDPPQPRYSNYGYYEKSFMSGVPIGFASDIYEDLLDYLRSQGVKAYLDIVIMDAGE